MFSFASSHEHPGSYDSRQESPSSGTCRTCKGCRRKKIRCDGQRPRCRACLSRDQVCEYPQDGRRADIQARGRGRDAEVRQLCQELEELRHQNRTLQMQPNLPEVCPDPGRTAVNIESNCLTSGLNRPCDADLCSSNPYTAPDGPRQHDQRHSAEGVHHTLLSPVSVLGHTSEPLNNLRLPSPVSSADGSESRVYGATSLLHNRSFAVLRSAASPTEAELDGMAERAAQHELVSNAAIGRQQESTIYSMPSVSSKMDFDGVPMDLAMYLLDLHWNWQHLSYLVTYRPAIMDSLVNGGPYTNKLLLNAIFFSASLYSDHNSLRLSPEDPGTTGRAFYNRFKDLLAGYVDEPTMPTIVALILCGSSLVPHGEQSAGWLFCGMAYRMIIDLGYHLDIATSPQTDPNIRLTATDMEIRKRVYWGAYVCDTFQSLFLGRPPTLLKVDCHIPHKYLDTYEEMEEWKPCVDAQTQLGICAYQTQPCYALSAFENLRRLCAVANKIMDKFYSTTCSNTPETAALQSRHELRLLLEHWKHGLPSNLRFDPETDNVPPPHRITLHTTYWALVILTEQPFLKPGHFNFGPGPQCQTEAKERCIEAALQIWKLVEAYKNVFTLRRAQYGMFYATYGAVLVMLQHAPQDSEGYIRCIQFFWSALLEYQNGCSKGLKRPLDLLKPLLHRVENVWQRINVDDPGDALQSHSSGTLCNHLRKHSSSEHLEAQESWSDLSCTNAPGLESADSLDWLASISGDLCFTDDTVFGMFMQNDSDI